MKTVYNIFVESIPSRSRNTTDLDLLMKIKDEMIRIDPAKKVEVKRLNRMKGLNGVIGLSWTVVY